MTSRPPAPVLGLDPRSLAAFRIGLGALVLVDLATRLPDLEAHYADTGVLPRSELLEQSSWSTVSLHLASGSVVWQGVLFALAAAAAGALLLGWRTRVATAASWFLLASLHARNPAILHGGDAFLRLLLFWAMFVPLGRAASLDRRQGRLREDPAGPVLSVGTVALSLQICFLYWFSGLHKLHPAWMEDGTALGLALRLDQLATPLGRRLLELPEGLLALATRGAMVLELAGPFLVWIPWATGRFRGFAVGLFAGFHLLGLAPLLYLDLFPWVCAVAWTVFLPPGFWSRVGRTLGPASRPEPGRATVARRWNPARRRWRAVARWGGRILAASALVFVLLWNLRTLQWDRWVRWLPEAADPFGEVAGLHQVWNLFAPYPSEADGWYSFVGRLADGREVDVRTGLAPLEGKPDSVGASLGPPRWRKLLMNLPSRKYRRMRRGLGLWLCHDWNRRGREPRLEEVRIVFWSEPTGPGGEEGPVREVPLWQQVCPQDGDG